MCCEEGGKERVEARSGNAIPELTNKKSFVDHSIKWSLCAGGKRSNENTEQSFIHNNKKRPFHTHTHIPPLHSCIPQKYQRHKPNC